MAIVYEKVVHEVVVVSINFEIVDKIFRIHFSKLVKISLFENLKTVHPRERRKVPFLASRARARQFAWEGPSTSIPTKRSGCARSSL